MDQDNRVSFELVYKLIVDIQNFDFEIDLPKALTILESLMSDYWLFKIYLYAKLERQESLNN